MMRITKEMKETTITFNEKSNLIDIYTCNADLKRRLTGYAEKHPRYCRQTDDDGFGGLRFEIEKGRLSFRLTAPYTEERRKAMRQYANDNNTIVNVKGNANERKD